MKGGYMKTKVMYKFLNEVKGKIKSEHGKQTWKIGKTYTLKGEIRCCENGFHASAEPLEALSYVKGNILAIVEGSGDEDKEADKSAFRSMKITHAYKWTTKDSIQLAIYLAEQVIKIYEYKYPDDSRPRDAIKAAKAYLKYPSKKRAHAAADAAHAAHAAAYAAAHAAAHAAYAAAYVAAYAAYAADAAYAAAYVAAHAASHAAHAAYAAADAALTAKINRWIKKHIKKLEEIK